MEPTQNDTAPLDTTTVDATPAAIDINTDQNTINEPTAPLPPYTGPVSDAQLTPVDEGGYDLDLDLLQPQSRKVRLNGQIYEVFPPKVKDIATLARLAGELQKQDSADVQTKVDQMIGAFASVMPALKDSNVNLTMEQLIALFQFVNSMVNPAENSALKSYGIEPSTEKKIQQG